MSDAPAAVEEGQVEDLRDRLRRSRFVDGVPGDGWDRGTDRGYLEQLVRYWAEDFDWRAAEAALLDLPWTRTSNGMRALHQRASDPAAPAVVLLHGWPDSFLRYSRVLPLLTDVHVIVPCLPGYPYSGLSGLSREAMAEPIAGMLAELGYAGCVVSGGDIGSGAAESLARTHPELVGALHLTDIPLSHLATLAPSEITDAEQAYLESVSRWRAAEGAYIAEQNTKPNTLAAALGDSPVGLAAWIVEKLRSWSDCGGDVESVFPRDDLLTWISLYWFTGTIGTSFVPYAMREPARPGRVVAPTAVSLFPRDLLPAPRSLADRVFDVRAWTEHEAGGHFPAWEQPEDFVSGLRGALALASS